MTSRSAAVLTVSDSAAAPGASHLDSTGPFIATSLTSHGLTVASTSIVSDSVEGIRAVVGTWVDGEGIDLVLLTGGTGWGLRDVTIQAISPLISKPLPGLSLALTSYGLSKTPLAAMSNPFAGIAASKTGRRVLVVALPGSKGGVKDGMAVLLPLLDHALALLGNGVGCATEVEQLHGPRSAVAPISMATPSSTVPSSASHGHECAHHHRHPRPNGAVSSRQRHSPHPMIPLDEALAIILREIGSSGLGVESRPVDSSLIGHVLAESVSAPHNLPLWHSTNVDGYACHSADGPGDYPVRPKGSGLPLEGGQIERVNTGGPIPSNADSVIMVEDTELLSASATGEELEVRILAPGTRPGENVRQPGSDLKEGEVVMDVGEVIGGAGGEVGVLGSVGRRQVMVHRKPRVALLSTGSELVDLSASLPGVFDAQSSSDPPPLPPRPGKPVDKSVAAPPDAASSAASGAGLAAPSWTGIYDSNRPSLKAVIESMGWEVLDLGVVRDETGAHEEAMHHGLSVADVVISTGGTSMGEGDLVKPLLEHTFNAKIHFGRVAMAPGKPTTFATVPSPSASGETSPRDKVFFALPGNPASALVTFFVFVVPALRGLGGWKEGEGRGLRKIWVQLAHPLPISNRPTYHRCTIAFSSSGLPVATSTGGQRSSRVASLKGAEVLVLVEAGEGGQAAAGHTKEALLLPSGWSS